MASNDEPPIFWAIRTTKRARSDMEAAEERLAALTDEEIAKLVQFPTMWPLAEEDKLFRESVRRMLYRRTPRRPEADDAERSTGD